MPYHGEYGNYDYPAYRDVPQSHHGTPYSQPMVVVPQTRHDVQQAHHQLYQQQQAGQYVQNMPRPPTGSQNFYNANVGQQYYSQQQAMPQMPQAYYQPAASYAQQVYPQASTQNSQERQIPRQQYHPQTQRASAQARLPSQSRTQPSPQPHLHSQPYRPAAQGQHPPPTAARPTPTPQRPQQRTAYVQIPVQRPAQSHSTPIMPRSPKRRKSNEGAAVAVCHGQGPQESFDASGRVALANPPPASSPLTELNSSQVPPAPPPNVDYQAVLLSLADEYVTAAYGLSASIASDDSSDTDLDEYHALMSTAMGCLESALKNCRQPEPRMEALIRLRLATLLHDETENSEQAEEVLSNGIALCERSHLHDQKYAMHHLLIRIAARSSPRAAMKSADKLVKEVEALKLVHWFYAFRFLRVSLGLQADGNIDSSSILKHLTAITNTASDFRHVGVQITSATLEALVHLRSGSAEATELAQRALAAARAHQFSSEMQQLPQLEALLDCLDLACTLMLFKLDQIEQKLQKMQDSMDAANERDGWRRDGGLFVPLPAKAPDGIDSNTGGIMTSSKEGELAIVFKWVTRHQLILLGHLLSGIASMHKNAKDSKSEMFIGQSLLGLDAIPRVSNQSLTAIEASSLWQASMSETLNVQLVLACCARNDWLLAEQTLKNIQTEGLDDDFNRALRSLASAMCKHGLGDLEAALALYRRPELTFSATSKSASGLKDLQAVATLSTILILQKDRQAEADLLALDMDRYCSGHKSLAICSAHMITKASNEILTGQAIVKTKKHLQTAIKAAQNTSNHQLLCMVVSIMSSCFFHGIVGEQALGSVRASRGLGKRAGNRLWTAVADNMYAETLRLSGEPAEADIAMKEARDMMDGLPPVLQQRLREDLP